MSVRASAWVVGMALAANGCAAAPTVSRVYDDGRVTDGRYVESAAYASLLRGAIAEAAGDPRGALASYDRAARIDPRSPEIAARIGAVRCMLDPRDEGADDAFGRALTMDPSYAPAWAAKAACAAARGDRPAADRAASEAFMLRPARGAEGVRAALFSGGAVAEPGADAAVKRLMVTARDPAATLEAIAAWAREHDAVPLWARALELQVAVAPSTRASVAQQVNELAGLGRAADARAVAAAVADVGDAPDVGGPLSCARCELAKRLAVDEAIGRDDAATARARASRVGLTLAELAARWLLAGRPEQARAVAREVADADAAAVGPRLVLAAIDSSAESGRAVTALAPVSAATWFAWAAAVARERPVDAARAALLAIPRDEAAPDDDVVLREAVVLGARGVLAEKGLPTEAVVELRAVRWGMQATGPIDRGPLPNADDVAAEVPDLRHEYLRLAVVDAASPRARDLGARLGRLAPRDRVVAAAAAIESVRNGEAIDPTRPRSLLAIDPSDPLIAAVALRLAVNVGDADVARRARAVLGSP